MDQLIRNIEEIYILLLNWFKHNEMMVNYDKCHLLLHGNEDRLVNTGNYLIRNSPN